MIQVLARAFQLLETISERGEAGLGDLSKASGLRNNTASNILKSLKDLGYLEKGDRGFYRLSGKVAELNRSGSRAPQAFRLVQKSVSDLTAALSETAVAAFLHQGRRYLIARAEADQEVKVQSDIKPSDSIFRHVTGRILIAHLKPSELKKFLKTQELPGKDEWPQAINSNEFKNELKMIRQNQIAKQVRQDVFSVAVPIFGKDGEILASMGLTIPEFRAAPKRDHLITSLKNAANDLSKELANLCHRDLAKHLSGVKK